MRPASVGHCRIIAVSRCSISICRSFRPSKSFDVFVVRPRSIASSASNSAPTIPSASRLAHARLWRGHRADGIDRTEWTPTEFGVFDVPASQRPLMFRGSHVRLSESTEKTTRMHGQLFKEALTLFLEGGARARDTRSGATVRQRCHRCQRRASFSS